MLINLVNNAIKFTPSGQVTVRLAAVPPSQGAIADAASLAMHLHIAVIDTGVGIAPDEQQTIFQAFEQTQTGKMSPDGTGLGLAISQHLVAQMGGQLTVASQLGQGSRFEFTIPVEVGSADDLPLSNGDRSNMTLSPGQPRYRILVVDDSPMNRQVVAQFLTYVGFLVAEAENGQQAIEQWQTWQPHLILTDIRMPQLDGLELIQAIRSIEAQKLHPDSTIHPVKIIVLTAAVLEQHSIAQWDDWILKPVDLSHLLDAIAQQLPAQYDMVPMVQTTHALVPAIASQDLAVMPQEWLHQLRIHALRCDDMHIRKLIAQIPDESIELRRSLKSLNQQFQLETILNLVDQCLAEHTD